MKKRIKNSKTNQNIFDLSGRTALITGGAGLLGKKHAEALASFGANIIIVDLRNKEASQLIKTLQAKYSIKALAITADITKPKQVEKMVITAVEKMGSIDILINNAAMTVKSGGKLGKRYFSKFEEYPFDLWEEAIKVNLNGVFLCSQTVGKVMLKQKKGVIVNIASDVGVISPDHRIYKDEKFNTPLSYAVSKAGIISLTRYLATYWAKKNIRVNSLSPAGVFNNHDQRFVDKLSACIPLGRMAHVDEYQGAIIYLSSDASSFMTGSNLIVDGGRTCW
jgi:NAD(P)-dependent dehydrogenase (short-subunit alcohol dehydrogenase family)